MDFNIGNLVSGVVGAVASVVVAATMIGGIAGATAGMAVALAVMAVVAVAKIGVDDQLSIDNAEEFLKEIYKTLAGALVGIFTSKSSEISSNKEYTTKKGGPSLDEAAAIAADVYSAKAGDPEILGGWKIIGDPIIDGSLQMAIYGRRGPDGKMEYVIANAGTEPTSIADWKNNAQQPFGDSPDMRNSLAQAERFVRDHRDDNITFVGHSKGGAEAAGNAVYMNKDAIVFNPASVNLEAYGLRSSDYSADMTAYIVRGEALNNVEGWASEPVGKVIYLPTQYPVIPIETHTPADSVIKSINTANAIENHLMPSVQNAIKQYETDENVIISRTVDNKVKEAGEKIAEPYKKSYEEWKYNYNKGINDFYNQIIDKNLSK